MIQLCTIGLLAGLLPGLIGMGPGSIMVPLLHIQQKKPLKDAIRLSLAVTSIIAGIGILCHGFFNHSYPDPQLILMIYCGGFIGTFMGSRLRKILPARKIKFIFSIFLLLVVIKSALQLESSDGNIAALSVYYHLGAGFLACLCASLTGIGGGIVIGGVYTGFFGVPIETSILLALYNLFMTATLSSLTDRSPLPEKNILFLMCFGAAFGMLLGFFTHTYLPAYALKLLFLGFTCWVVFKMFRSLFSTKQS
jgi:uncharacterized membrane protein YfcA